MSNPLSSLRSCHERTMKHIDEALEKALAAIQRKISHCTNPASAAEQHKLYREIRATYFQFGRMTTDQFKQLAFDSAKVASSAAGESSAEDLVKFDRKRLARYWQYVAPTNGSSLAAVFTDKMSEQTIQQLRTSLIDVNRQAAVEGWTMKEIRKKIGEEWRDLAKEDVQFTDRSGRTWDNKQYLEMLTRTTAQRVYTDAYADRLCESGFKLARITNLGGEPDCAACKAWQDVIVVLAGKGGKYPTLADARAAGVFHPNCMCSLEYIDEEIDADEIDRQKKAGKVDWSDAEAMQKRTDEIKVDALQADGMTHEEAVDELTRQRVDDAIRAGAAIDGRQIAEQLTHEQLAQIRESGIPTIQLAKKGETAGWNHGAAGGVLRVDRTQKTESILESLTGETQPKAPAQPEKAEEKKEEPQPQVKKFEPNTNALDEAIKKLEEAAAFIKTANSDIRAVNAEAKEIKARANELLYNNIQLGEKFTELASKINDVWRPMIPAYSNIVFADPIIVYQDKLDAFKEEFKSVETEADQAAFDAKVAQALAGGLTVRDNYAKHDEKVNTAIKSMREMLAQLEKMYSDSTKDVFAVADDILANADKIIEELKTLSKSASKSIDLLKVKAGV